MDSRDEGIFALGHPLDLEAIVPDQRRFLFHELAEVVLGLFQTQEARYGEDPGVARAGNGRVV